MEPTTIALLKILGPVFLLMSFAVFFRPLLMEKIIFDFLEEDEELFQWGSMSFLLGVIIIQFHNIWTGIPESIVSLTGWIAIAQGILFILFPTRAKKFIRIFSPSILTIYGILALFIGTYFCWEGLL